MITRIAVVLGASLLSLTPMLAHAQYPPPDERTLDVNGFTSDCILDAPWVFYEVKTIGFSAGPETRATITISDINDDPITVLENMPLSGQFLYPGAEVDEDGKGTAWPGWEFDEATGEWRELGPDEGNTIWRRGLNMQVDVNPTGFTEVGYPDATPNCLGPNVTSSSPPPGESAAAPESAGTLPRTGSDSTNLLLQGGALLLLAGGIFVIASHRRRNQAAA